MRLAAARYRRLSISLTVPDYAESARRLFRVARGVPHRLAPAVRRSIAGIIPGVEIV
jgi:hypothetical protein